MSSCLTRVGQNILARRFSSMSNNVLPANSLNANGKKVSLNWNYYNENSNSWQSPATAASTFKIDTSVSVNSTGTPSAYYLDTTPDNHTIKTVTEISDGVSSPPENQYQWIDDSITPENQWIDDTLSPERQERLPSEIECKQHWFRKIARQREQMKGLLKLRKTDCGPRRNLWEWWRDRQIARKKKKNYI